MHLLVQYMRKGGIHLRSGQHLIKAILRLRHGLLWEATIWKFSTRDESPTNQYNVEIESPQVMNFFPQKRSDDSNWEPKSLCGCAFNKWALHLSFTQG